MLAAFLLGAIAGAAAMFCAGFLYLRHNLIVSYEFPGITADDFDDAFENAMPAEAGWIASREACSLPIAVLDDDEPITLGSSQTNGLLFAISYKGNVVYFNFAHNFCGGFGAMFWIKSTLWQYYTDLGYDIAPEGLFVPDSPQLDGETSLPDPDSLPLDEPIWEYHSGDSFVPMKDFLGYVIKPTAVQVYTPIEIETEHLMKYAREHDGSPNSIFSALMFKTCSRLFPNASQISGGIVCNYQRDVGCPNTYHDLVRLLHVRYTPKLRDWPVDRLSTATRAMIIIMGRALRPLKT